MVSVLSPPSLQWCLFEVKLTFEMLTVRGRQHSFSTHEWMFLWKCQRFWDKKSLDLQGTRTPNLRIHAECSNHLSYQGQTFAVPCLWTLGLAVMVTQITTTWVYIQQSVQETTNKNHFWLSVRRSHRWPTGEAPVMRKDFQCHNVMSWICSQIARFMGPPWGPPGPCRPQMGPMLVPWTLLSHPSTHQGPGSIKVSSYQYSVRNPIVDIRR